MSYLAFGLDRRRKTAELRRGESSGLVSPPMEHPELGVAGRSIELSLGLGHPCSPDAIVLAAEALHEWIEQLSRSGASATLNEVASARSAIDLLNRASVGVELGGETIDLLKRVEREVTKLS
jgi:hypothetical protein